MEDLGLWVVPLLAVWRTDLGGKIRRGNLEVVTVVWIRNDGGLDKSEGSGGRDR